MIALSAVALGAAIAGWIYLLLVRQEHSRRLRELQRQLDHLACEQASLADALGYYQTYETIRWAKRAGPFDFPGTAGVNKL